MGLVKIDSLPLTGLNRPSNQISSYSIGARDYFMTVDYLFNGYDLHVWEVTDNGILVDVNIESQFGDAFGGVDVAMLTPSKFTVVETNAGVFAFSFGYFANSHDDTSPFGAPLNVFAVDAEGELTRVAVENTPTVLSQYDEILSIGARDFLIHPQSYNFGSVASLQVYNVSDPFAPEELFNTMPDAVTVATTYTTVNPIEALEFQNNGYVMIRDGANYAVYRLGSQGALKSQTDWYDNLNNAYSNFMTIPRAPTDIASVVMGDDVFIYTAGVGLRAHSMAKNGMLESIYTNIAGASRVETFEIDGQHFLAAVGGNLTIYAITDIGHLTFVDIFITSDTSITSLDVVQKGGETFLVTTGYDQNARELVTETIRFRVPDVLGVEGGDGVDVLRGSVFGDWLKGGRDADRLIGKEGDDTIEGGQGADQIFGGDGYDALSGGTGRDVIAGGAGNDFIEGGFGNDTLSGGTGIDVLRGGEGKDIVKGGDQDDLLYGGSSNDKLYGEDGDDVLYDGRGRDILRGGAGDDIYVFTNDGRLDSITDYEDGELLHMTDYGTGLNRASLSFVQIDADTLEITIGGDRLRITAADGSIQEDDFSLEDFVFL